MKRLMISMIMAIPMMGVAQYKVKIPKTPSPTIPPAFYGGTESISVPSPTYEEPEEEKTISIRNKGYDSKKVSIYFKDSYLKWEYLKTVRIPAGSMYQDYIGKYEYENTYGYLIEGGLIKTVTYFSTYTVNIY